MSNAVDAVISGWLERYGALDVSLGHILCDAHLTVGAPAVVYVSDDGEEVLSYERLRRESMRLAGTLSAAGVKRGDRVAVMLPKSAELVVALVGILRLGAVYVPLFTAFGPDAAGYRIEHSGAQVVVTDHENRAKLRGAEDMLRLLICVGESDAVGAGGDVGFQQAVQQGEEVVGTPVSGDDLMILLYTSGTTGQPKGVEVPVRALASIHAYMHYGLDLRKTDVFWNFADPGWAYGLWYGVIGALLLGRTMLLRALPFDPAKVFGTITGHGVTNLAGAPTAYRALRSAGAPVGFRSENSLRVISSAGEPLNAELLEWSARDLGVGIHDHYGQSEIGMVVGFAQHERLHRAPVPGSMGFALPGFRVVVLDEHGREVGADIEGEIAIDIEHSPLYWFRGYFEDRERTAERFRHGARYYLTADAARQNATGLFHFGARADDVITSSGYRIGPFEVESALISHPAVLEVAVVGTPDDLRGEAVTAFIVTTKAPVEREALTAELQSLVKRKLAKHLYPRTIVYLASLPRTPSGKLQRNVLKSSWQSGASDLMQPGPQA